MVIAVVQYYLSWNLDRRVMMEIQKCPVCGNEKIKKGKIHGFASVLPLNSRNGAFGSALIVSFCSECGEVLSSKVDHPEKVKYDEKMSG